MKCNTCNGAAWHVNRDVTWHHCATRELTQLTEHVSFESFCAASYWTDSNTDTRRVTGSHEAEVWVFWCQHGWLRQICLAWIVSLCKLRLATWSKGVNTLTPQRHEVCSSKSSKTVTRVLEIDFEWRKVTSVRSVMFSHTGAFSRRRMNVRSGRFLVVMTGGTEHHWSPQMGLQGAQAAQVHGISYSEAPPDEAIQK